MSIDSIVKNKLVQEPSLVWRMPDQEKFGYSDGAASERYLEEVFKKSADLGTRSDELEKHIKDWVSEYHLTSKRAQLLSGFKFDRSARVLEVGCGCGAITRFLGETFDQVVSIEGSIHRARLARLRTRDLPNVSIICSPFQKIEFTEPFDFIFCIGVYEYSASFIEGDDPYDAALKYFASMLKPDGVLVVAIENQFGLKYFTSAGEDHVGVMFEGVMGYHSALERVRTFGQKELRSNLEKYFDTVKFFYPYPDYKLPVCVLAEDFLSSARAGEIVSQTRSRDYGTVREPLWDESLASLELARNGMLPFFANSFLVFAAKEKMRGMSFDAEAVMYSPSQRARFRSVTRIEKGDNDELMVTKKSVAGAAVIDGGPVKWVPTTSRWIDAQSLSTEVFSRSQRRNVKLEFLFAPCRPWARMLESLAVEDRGTKYLTGQYLDCTWSNAYVREGVCEAVDLEWVWAERLRLNVVVIRAIYLFLLRMDEGAYRPRALRLRSGRRLIRDIAKTLGIDLTDADFSEFVSVESRLQNAVTGIPEGRVRAFLRWFLFDWPSLARRTSLTRFAQRISASLRARLGRLAGAN
jgi:protein-L-isoaspartate O-methyltransferase